MNVITVKRPLRKGTPDTMINMTDRRQYRRSLVLRSFRQISRSYFASEKGWEFVVEALLFAIIVAISVWPVFAAANALNNFCSARQAERVDNHLAREPSAQTTAPTIAKQRNCRQLPMPGRLDSSR